MGTVRKFIAWWRAGRPLIMGKHPIARITTIEGVRHHSWGSNRSELISPKSKVGKSRYS